MTACTERHMLRCVFGAGREGQKGIAKVALR
jgi:hypothetical protein